ncbi:MAG: cytochrome c [Gemmobacter sp.]|nr:cytochrome c [Gemmobacter sp.]
MPRLLHLSALLSAVLALPAAGQDVAEGQSLFTRYCATCHGIEAKGQGPMAPVLMVQPTDLTALSSGNAGVFPMIRVVMRIDGRDPLVSHGSSMPLFGQLFGEQDTPIKAPNGMPILTTKPIADLVAWLQTVQQ